MPEPNPMGSAFFGRPGGDMQEGGAHISVYLVPCWDGRLAVFEIAEPEQFRGRWLPWTVLPFRANPWEIASALADEWCGVGLADLSLVDVMSFDLPGEGWELAVIFRAECAAAPVGDNRRRPVFVDTGEIDAIGSFDPVDLERWVEGGGRREEGAAGGGGLVF
ncbi:MAG: hypothetical protein WEC33_06255 [Dehalococcoidia bacterium]